MKAKYKVSFEELDKNTNFSYPEEIRDIIQKNINRVNRSSSISKRDLESRSLMSQEILYTLKQLPKKDIVKIENTIIKDRAENNYDYTSVKKCFERILKKHCLCFGSLDIRLKEAISLVMGLKLY